MLPGPRSQACRAPAAGDPHTAWRLGHSGGGGEGEKGLGLPFRPRGLQVLWVTLRPALPQATPDPILTSSESPSGGTRPGRRTPPPTSQLELQEQLLRPPSVHVFQVPWFARGRLQPAGWQAPHAARRSILKGGSSLPQPVHRTLCPLSERSVNPSPAEPATRDCTFPSAMVAVDAAMERKSALFPSLLRPPSIGLSSTDARSHQPKTGGDR